MSKEKTVKSNHKHSYENCLLQFRGFRRSIGLGKRCSICGFIKIQNLFITDENPDTGCFKLLNDNEILEKYNGLPIYGYDWNVKYIKDEAS